MVHLAGYIYNDLKPDNVVINIVHGQPVAALIDLGLTTKYLDQNGRHFKNTEMTSSFKGNYCFASLDSMNFFKTSRKDDLISLF